MKGKINVKNVIWFILIILIFIRLFLFPIQVVGDSMCPTYNNGDMLMSNIFINRNNLERGDIITFYERASNKVLIKRIIGVPGDEIKLTTNGLVINDQLFKDDFSTNMEYPKIGMAFWRLEEGEYFVLGDNRNYSIDSRSFGKVSKIHILSKIQSSTVYQYQFVDRKEK